MPLADLEDAAGVRWVDIHHAELRTARAMGVLNRVCDGKLTQRMARDLPPPGRFPAPGPYGSKRGRMPAAFLVRRLKAATDAAEAADTVASVLKPVQILI